MKAARKAAAVYGGVLLMLWCGAVQGRSASAVLGPSSTLFGMGEQAEVASPSANTPASTRLPSLMPFDVGGYAESDQGANAYTIPWLPPASNRMQQGFVRIINRSGQAGSVNIAAIDDTGRRYGPVALRLESHASVHFNSQDLEQGNAGKGLARGIGNGSGGWRLELTSPLVIDGGSYIRTPDGFVAPMHDVARELPTGSKQWDVPIANPGKNRNQRSTLRLVNAGTGRAQVEISATDDRGRPAREGKVRMNLAAGAARTVTVQDLEGGASGLSGRLGSGTGKWRLMVKADQPLLVMSLLQLPTGHVTNLSRGFNSSAPATPPAAKGPDLIVASVGLSPRSPYVGDDVTASATIRNDGDASSAATTVQFYSSLDATISRDDVLAGKVQLASLPAGGSRTVTLGTTIIGPAGTFYGGACVDVVEGETDTSNNCSKGLKITSRTPTLTAPRLSGRRFDCTRGSYSGYSGTLCKWEVTWSAVRRATGYEVYTEARNAGGPWDFADSDSGDFLQYGTLPGVRAPMYLQGLGRIDYRVKVRAQPGGPWSAWKVILGTSS